jgi:antitoxin (DNA-binding transcriptional repressor) of toxin-antitoxin stability system
VAIDQQNTRACGRALALHRARELYCSAAKAACFTPIECDTMSHMKTITIRELHEQTGRWVRKASAGEVYVTERGRLIAKIVPASPLPAKPFFANPRFTRAYLAQRKSLRGGTDSTKIISEDRDREVG